MVKQVKFRDPTNHEIYGGILLTKPNLIICGQCGAMIYSEEVDILDTYPDWVNISDAIIGE